jgi:hypothetical protein
MQQSSSEELRVEYTFEKKQQYPALPDCYTKTQTWVLTSPALAHPLRLKSVYDSRGAGLGRLAQTVVYGNDTLEVTHDDDDVNGCFCEDIYVVFNNKRICWEEKTISGPKLISNAAGAWFARTILVPLGFAPNPDGLRQFFVKVHELQPEDHKNDWFSISHSELWKEETTDYLAGLEEGEAK